MNTLASSVDRIDRVGASSAVWQTTVRAASSEPGIWERLKGIFSTPVRGVESLINARENFKAFLLQQARALGNTLSPEHRDGLIAQGQDLMQQILKNSLDPLMDTAISRGDGKVGEAGLGDAIRQAHEKAELALMQLQSIALRARIEEAPARDMRPQMIMGPNQSIRVLRPAPSIENLVLRGGGAKGIGNAAALTEMENAGMLTGLQKIVGTSVGGLTAVSLASGHRIRELSELTDKLNMWELTTTPKNFGMRYPSVDVDCRVGFHSGRALELLDEISAGSVASYLNDHWETRGFQKKLAALRRSEGEESLARLNALRTQDFNADRTRQMITFNDLALMHRLDPANFKHLVLTGWDLKNERMSYFAHENTPHMPIAVAGRISMSLPVLFKSVTYDPGDTDGRRTFVDGGVGSNVSTEVVFDGLQGRDLVEARVRTAVMTFDQGGEAYTVMHESSRKRNAFLNWVLSKVSGNPNFGEAAKNDDAKVKDAGPNTFVVFHGDIGTLDLSASAERVEKAKLQSTLKALEQIEQRQGQAYMVECRSVQECFAMLTEAEKQALRQGGAPNPLSYPLRNSDPAYRLQSQLYDLSLPDPGKWSKPASVQIPKGHEAKVQVVSSNRFALLSDELDELESEASSTPAKVQFTSSTSVEALRAESEAIGLKTENSSGQVGTVMMPAVADQVTHRHKGTLGAKSYSVKDLLALLEAEKLAASVQAAVPDLYPYTGQLLQVPFLSLSPSTAISVDV